MILVPVCSLLYPQTAINLIKHINTTQCVTCPTSNILGSSVSKSQDCESKINRLQKMSHFSAVSWSYKLTADELKSTFLASNYPPPSRQVWA